jgi:hypothetical protein
MLVLLSCDSAYVILKYGCGNSGDLLPPSPPAEKASTRNPLILDRSIRLIDDGSDCNFLDKAVVDLITGADQYTVWNTDNGGNYVSSALTET